MFAEAAVMKSSRFAAARGVETNYSDQSVSGECMRVMVWSLPTVVYTLIPYTLFNRSRWDGGGA